MTCAATFASDRPWLLQQEHCAHTWNTPATCRIEQTPGLRDFKIYSNSVSLPMLLEWVEQQNLPCLHDTISLTGGEPLVHTPFLVVSCPIHH